MRVGKASWFLLLLLRDVVVASGACASSPTCSLHAGDAFKFPCRIKDINRISTWKSITGTNFPGLGLYTLLNISKDESDCCIDVKIQGFFCQAKRGGAAVSLLLGAHTCRVTMRTPV